MSEVDEQQKDNSYSRRKPNLSSEKALPADLSQLVKETAIALAEDTRCSSICGALTTFAAATVPEIQIHSVSKITTIVREQKTQEFHSIHLLVLEKFVFPFLFDYRVRYLHRALTTLLKACNGIGNKIMEERFKSSFTAKFVQSAPRFRRYDKTLKTEVMSYLNNLDCLSSTLMPLFPSVFSDSFVQVLPVLCEAFAWTIENVSGETVFPQEDTVVVLGEDLEHIRFAVRVVATYVHKYLFTLRGNWDTVFAPLRPHMERTLSTSFVMLGSDLFPKDLLNATGLLLASFLTSKAYDTTFIRFLCEVTCCAETPTALSEGTLHPGVQVLLQTMEKEPSLVLQHHSETLRQLFSTVTPNGRFALLKGLLAHLATPVSASKDIYGVLMQPGKDGTICLYDVVLPFTKVFSNSLQASETRFMAIQTVDSAIRYMVCSLEFVLSNVDSANAAQFTTVKSKHKSQEKVFTSIPPFCLPSAKLKECLEHVKQLVMDLWDDGTQQMSGTLYATYGEVLKVNGLLARCVELSDTKTASVHLINVHQTLKEVLCTQSERRGRYHALQALMSIVSPDVFINGVCELQDTHHGEERGIDTYCEGIAKFIVVLLRGASNHKIGNICGDVFATFALLLKEMKEDGGFLFVNREALLTEGVVRPLVKAICIEGYAPSTANVSPSVNISNLISHFVCPLLKKDDGFLSRTVDLLMEEKRDGSVGFNEGYYTQGVVEILSRGQSLGIKIGSYQSPFAMSSQCIVSGAQSLHSDLRYASISLRVLGARKFEPVYHLECPVVEAYFSFNMNLGGDTTGVKQVLEVAKKWSKRVADSYTSAMKPGGEVNPYDRPLTDFPKHCKALTAVFSENIGIHLSPNESFSIERVFVAMRCYSIFLHAVAHVLKAEHIGLVFCDAVVPLLLSTLSDGWGQARLAALELLQLFSEHTSLIARLSNAESVEQEKKIAYNAQAFRIAEGSALKIALFLSQQLKSDSSAFGPIVALLNDELTAIDELSKEIGADEGHKRIYKTPLHGRLSVSGETFKLCVHHSKDKKEVIEWSNRLLETCSKVFQACAAFVGTESGDGEESVDCRGHVFDKDTPDSESHTRIVVNNTWLSLRVAAGCVEEAIKAPSAGVSALNWEAIHRVAFDLVHTLLVTKHNGVMRCARSTLHTLCASLLRDRDTKFRQIPSEILQSVLGAEGVRSDNLSRMLRRSQGLPHIILSVLEAEDPQTSSLFSMTMQSVLEAAKETPSSLSEEVQLSQQSNALNVLKFIFDNRNFADRVVSYLEEVFSIATLGFKHPSWNIRNSSLILFSSVLHRFIGEHPSLGGAGVNTSLTDILKRTPAAFTFAFTEVSAAHHDNDADTVALFPVLQMLSMLSPSAQDASRAEDTKVRQMIEAVWACKGSRNLMVRSCSAAALTCIVPRHFIVSMVQRGTAVLTGAKDALYLNHVHGVLLQLLQFHHKYIGSCQHSVKAHRSNDTPESVRKSILEAIVGVLLDGKRELAACARVCPPISSTLLALMSNVLFFLPKYNLSKAGDVVSLSVELVKSALSCPLVQSVERDTVHEGAALSLIGALQLSLKHGQNAERDATREEIGSLIAESHRPVQDGRHTLFSSFLNQLNYCVEERLLESGDVQHILRSLSVFPIEESTVDALNALSYGIRQSTSPPLGCVAWWSLTSHVAFLAEFSETTGDKRIVALLEELLLLPVKKKASMEYSSEFVVSAIRYIVKYVHLSTQNVLEMLSYYAQADQMPHIRLSVVDAVRSSLGNVKDVNTTTCRYVLLLLCLLLDDSAEVRDAACIAVQKVSPEIIGSPRDVMTSILVLVLYLRDGIRQKCIQSDDVKMLLDLAEPDDETASGDESDANDEVLFEKESDNMFAESGFLKYLYSTITLSGTAQNTFTTLTKVLTEAEKSKVIPCIMNFEG